MRIVYLTTKVHLSRRLDEASGSTTHTLGVAKGLQAHGFDVHVLSQGRPGDRKFEKIDGVNVHRLTSPVGQGRTPKSLSQYGHSPFFARLKRLTKQAIAQFNAYPLAAQIKKINPETILMRATREGQGALISRLTGRPLILEVIDIQYGIKDAAAARRIIAYAKGLFPLNLQAKVQLVTAGFDPEIFKPAPEIKPTHDIGYFGAFKGWDGVEDLVLAAQIVIKKRPQTKFLLVGQGATLPAVKRQVKDNGLEKNFTFRGKYGLNDSAKTIARARIAVAPYNINRWQTGREINGKFYDGAGFEKYGFYFSPLRIFEYLACAKPFLAADYPSIRRILGDQTACLFRPGDFRQLAAKILAWLDQDIAPVQEQNAALASRYTWAKVVKDFNLK